MAPLKKSVRKKTSSKKGTGTSLIIKITLALLLCSIIFFVVLLLLPPASYTQGFESLTELREYCKKNEELVPLESENAVKPDFSKYYARFKPSILATIKRSLSRIAVGLRVKKRPPFSPSFFKYITEETLKKRAAKGLKKRSIEKVRVTEKTQCIIWGDLQGALHSFALDLEKLKELGFIDESLTLAKPDTYIIFMGNVMNRSPYTLEMLALLMQLLNRNPDRILYTRGSHESDGYWEEHTLQTELMIRLAHLSKEKVPLHDRMVTFFDSVTWASYLQLPDNNGNCFIRISRLDRKELPDQAFAGFLLDTKSPQYSTFSWQEPPVPALDTTQPEVSVKASFKIEKKRETYQPTDGLRLMEADLGTSCWTLISCPTPAYEKALKFYNDTFAIMSAAPSVNDWTIELYYQDRRNRTGFKTRKFNLISGKEIGASASPSAQTQSPAAQPALTQATPAPQTQQASAPAAPAAPAPAPATPAQSAAPASTPTQQQAPATPAAPAAPQAQSTAATPTPQAPAPAPAPATPAQPAPTQATPAPSAPAAPQAQSTAATPTPQAPAPAPAPATPAQPAPTQATPAPSAPAAPQAQSTAATPTPQATPAAPAQPAAPTQATPAAPATQALPATLTPQAPGTQASTAALAQQAAPTPSAPPAPAAPQGAPGLQPAPPE